MNKQKLSIIVIGASGHLARTKIFPALFALYCQDLLPDRFNIFGFSRSKYTDSQFRDLVKEHLTCRYTPGEETCSGKMEEFLDRCFYISGEYGSSDAYLDLYEVLKDREDSTYVNRLFYLAVPPLVFIDVARALGGAGFVSCGVGEPWSRVVVEKPFGMDRNSSDQLVSQLGQVFAEEQIFRIDHYLGKEVIQNLLVLRFANIVFEPIWNSNFIEKVEITWKENVGIEGRGGYFDRYGIIRDVMQNHLLQIVALIAMEPPSKLDAAFIVKEKVEVLKCMPPLQVDDIIIGQYAESITNGRLNPAYRDEETVQENSRTPTFAAAVLRINNERWKDVPFVMVAGKGLDDRMTEVRITFKRITDNIFCSKRCPDANELVIRVQPDESINLRVVNKIPGAGMNVESSDLDLQYASAFDEIIPDAYESLLVEVMRGDKSLFISSGELAAAWDVFTPVLNEVEAKALEPELYEFGSQGPEVIVGKRGQLAKNEIS